MVHNFALLILHVLEQYPDKELLRLKRQGEPLSFTGNSIRENVLSRLCQLKIQPREVVVLIPFGPEHIFWVIALQLRGSSVAYFPKKSLKRELLSGNRKTLILPRKGMVFYALFLSILGHRIVRWMEKNPETGYKIDHQPDYPALISYSSGSSGSPKRIERSHDLLIRQHLALKKAFPPSADQIDLPLFPNILLHNLACGVNTVLPPLDWNSWEDFFPGDILDAIAQEKITTLTGNLYYFRKLLHSARAMNYSFSEVKAVGIGGSPVPEWILADIQLTFPNAKVYVIYGSTEAEPIAIRLYSGKCDPLLGYCVGIPHPDIAVYIDKKGIFHHGDQKFDWGEICVTGPHVALPPGNKHLCTGDMGFLHEGGLYLTGRKDNCEAIGDYLPFQIEHYLQDRLNLSDVAAIGVNGTLRVYYIANSNEDETIQVCVLSQFGRIPLVCKRVPGIPKDDRHHSKTLYNELDENSFP
ncbi:MAG TPA: hypothetical protein DIW47_12255 [Bacteroidetes bacterium]|nr:hypothetical protein [Bacteroidota bacterium]